MSLFPFVTGWLGENHLITTTMILYGLVLFMAAPAYWILVRVLLSSHGPESTLAKAIRSDFNGRLSLIIYAAGMALACWQPRFSVALYVMVAVIWLVPDRRIARTQPPS